MGRGTGVAYGGGADPINNMEANLKDSFRAADVTEVRVSSHLVDTESNLDRATVDSFADEWTKFADFSEEEIERLGDCYFDVLDESDYARAHMVLDAGCGSGRWSRYLAGKVGHIEAIDPNSAVTTVAQRNADLLNVNFVQASIANLPFPDRHFDLVVCLGVLHHMPDTREGLRSLARKTKPGGKIVLYLYYSLDNRGSVYHALFKMSAVLRAIISKMPRKVKQATCDFIAVSVYWPASRTARIVNRFRPRLAEEMPLFVYANTSMHILRNDALDRFGTPLEQRFSKHEIASMISAAGFHDVRFSNKAPFWHCIATRDEANGAPP